MLQELEAFFHSFSDWMYENINDSPHMMYPVILLASILIMVLIYYLFKAILDHCASITKLCGFI
ncbi:MAG: hypothetical protein AABX70_05110 [Nanoarchaeota archaeon]